MTILKKKSLIYLMSLILISLTISLYLKKNYVHDASVNNCKLAGEMSHELYRKKLNTSKNSSSAEIYDEVVKRRHPNLPLYVVSPTKYASSVPDVVSVRWNGIVYQDSWKYSPKFLLYSAHFDARPKSGLAIRLLTLYDGEEELEAPFKLYCRMWFTNMTNEVFIPVEDATLMYHMSFQSDYLNPYGLTCKVPKPQNSNKIPIAVSLVKEVNSSKPSNILKIFGSSEKKKGNTTESKSFSIGICGKALFYYNDDFSLRLIEWIEIMKLLGVSKIFLYKTACHKNVEKVLDFYEKIGFVSIITFYYPPPYVQEGTFLRIWTLTNREPYRRAQYIYLNDCLLRNKDNYDYLGFFDSDEIPLIRKHKTLQDFIQDQLKSSEKKVGSLYLKWKHFYTDLKQGLSAENISEQFYILRHNTRTKLSGAEEEILETNGKSIYDTNYVKWAGIHKPLHFFKDTGATLVTTDREIAYTAHYGNHKCRSLCFEENLIEENTLLKYKDRIIYTVINVRNILNLK